MQKETTKKGEKEKKKLLIVTGIERDEEVRDVEKLRRRER